jgi:DNA-binding response OmpR family regulator
MLTTTRDQASNENDPASFAILVVDDVPSYRTVLELALAGPGRDIVSVSNVDSASELMGIRRFGLVISDYSMPGGTGIDLLRKIRRTDRVQPFVLMSSDLPANVARVAALEDAFLVDKNGGLAELTALLEAIEG